MEWWQAVYFEVYFLLAVAGIWNDFSEKRGVVFLSAAILSNIIILYLSLSYWYPSVNLTIGYFAPVSLIAAICWEMCQVYLDLLTPEPSEEESSLSRKEKKVIAFMMILFYIPAFFVAGKVAFQF